MKDKRLVIGVLAALAVAVIAIFFIAKPFKSGGAAKPAAGQKAVKEAMPERRPGPAQAAPAKKTFSADMGGLTVKVVGANNRPMSVRVKAFKAVDANMSALMASFISNKTQELAPGDYDIVVDSVPAMVYKNITVRQGKETVKDIGQAMGTLSIKVLDSRKKAAAYPARLLYPKSNTTVRAFVTNRPIEVMAGVYDVEIGIRPKIVESGVTIEAGKEKVLDMGAITGSLNVKVVDQGGKLLRYGLRVSRQDKGDVIAVGTTNVAIELLPGVYSVELLTKPAQSRNDIKISGGSETSVDFGVESPSVPAPSPAMPQPVLPAGPAAEKR